MRIATVCFAVTLAATALAQPRWAYNTHHAGGSGSVLPPLWSQAYTSCAAGDQSPVNFAASAAITTDGSLRPLALNWFPTNNFTVDVVPFESLTITPLDVNAALWEPNQRLPLALSHVAIHSPSLHTFGGGHRDAELLFVHRTRDEAATPVVVSVTLVASPTRIDNEVLRTVFYPQLARGVAMAYGVPQTRTVDFGALAPALRDYIMYDAAMPYPPCEPGARFYVMDEAVGISAAQLALIREALGYGNITTAGAPAGNYRPPQPLNRAARFVDFVGDSVSEVTPRPARLNQDVESMATAALAMACASIVVGLFAMRVAAA